MPNTIKKETINKSDSISRLPTKERILEVATTSFATYGYEATSLDEISGEVGVTKQTILYHFKSKDGLLGAVINSSLDKLTAVFEQAIALKRGIEAVVKAVFLMATRNPEVLGILREVLRLSGGWNLLVRQRLEPYMQQAQAYIASEMDAGRIKRANPQFILLAAYSTIIGVATEVEFLWAMGVQTSLKEAVVRRKELLDFLNAAIS